jgi:HK97 family phage prohead protease
MSKQVRFIPIEACGLKLREGEDGQPSRIVEGRAIVFGVRSRNLTPWSSSRVVYEVLEPGCITNEMLTRQDVVYNLNHSNKVTDILGRYRNSDADTLKLTLRGDGVDNRCELPNTSAANDTLELLKRGDITGQSFAFEDDWEDTENGVSYERTNDTENGKEVWIRHVKRITALYDVSIVTHPAYEQTSVATREQGDRINEAIEAQLKREQNTDDDPDKKGEGEGEETDEEREAREKAEREANGGETNAEKQAREEREAQEAKEQQEREAVAVMRMRRNRLSLMNRDLEDLFV